MIAPSETTNTQTEPAEAPVTVILPPRGWRSLKLRELWEYRELLYFLALRDVKVRYKQTGLGIAWALLQPFVTMVVFTIIFGRMAGFSSDSIVPYPILTYTALLPWQLFAGTLPRISNSLVGNANLLTKVYFPRMAIPLAALGAGLVDFLISFSLLVALIGWFSLTSDWHFAWSWSLLALPLLMLLAMLSSLAVGLWFAALNVQYRDVQHITPFLVQVWMFVSPVVYSPDRVPPGFWRVLYWLNPMAGVIQGFRWALLGEPAPGWMDRA